MLIFSTNSAISFIGRTAVGHAGPDTCRGHPGERVGGGHLNMGPFPPKD